MLEGQHHKCCIFAGSAEPNVDSHAFQHLHNCVIDSHRWHLKQNWILLVLAGTIPALARPLSFLINCDTYVEFVTVEVTIRRRILTPWRTADNRLSSAQTHRLCIPSIRTRRISAATV